MEDSLNGQAGKCAAHPVVVVSSCERGPVQIHHRVVGEMIALEIVWRINLVTTTRVMVRLLFVCL